MKKEKIKLQRQSFSSPAQLQKMARMVINRWQGVWTEAFSRHQALHQGQKSATLGDSASLSKPLQS